MDIIKKGICKFTGTKEIEIATRISVVHFNIVIYAFSYWITQPIFPFLSKDLGADPIVFGYLTTWFSIMQLIGGPVVGRLCDSQGPRVALILSQVGATLNYMFLGMATSVPMLFLSQIPTILMHCMHAAQASITSMSTLEGRATSLGRLSLSYGIGMILGSSLGGLIGRLYGNYIAAFVAALASGFAIPLNLMFLPTLLPSRTKPDNTSDQGLNLKAVGKLLKQSDIRNVMILQFVLGMGLSVYRTNFSQAMQLTFGLTAERIGHLMALGAVVSVITNTFIVGWISSKISEVNCIRGSMILLSACFLVYANTSSWNPYIVGSLTILCTVGSTLCYTLYTSRMTKIVSKEDSGTSIGLSHAIRTCCGIISPTLAGYLFQSYGLLGVGAFSMVATISSTILTFVFHIEKCKKSD